MARIVLAFFIFTAFASYSQTNLLTYKHKRYYTENNVIATDTVFKLRQSVYYNRPDVIDEEYCYSLYFTFIDTAAAKQKKIISLAIDTLIVNSSYSEFSVWNWARENTKVTGQIKIIRWSENEVTLKENITVYDCKRKTPKEYKGTRTFTRKNGW